MKWLIDTVERIVRSSLVAYLTYWVTLSTHDFSDFASHQALLTATGAAVGTLLLCLAAKPVGSGATASFVAKPEIVTRTVHVQAPVAPVAAPVAPVKKAAKKRTPAKKKA